MDFNLTSEQRLIQDATRRMSGREIVPILKANDPTRPLPKEAMHCILKACASQGLTAPRIPEADGGAGVSALTLGVMCGRRLAVKHYVWHGDDCGRVLSCVWPVGAVIVDDCRP